SGAQAQREPAAGTPLVLHETRNEVPVHEDVKRTRHPNREPLGVAPWIRGVERKIVRKREGAVLVSPILDSERSVEILQAELDFVGPGPTRNEPGERVVECGPTVDASEGACALLIGKAQIRQGRQKHFLPAIVLEEVWVAVGEIFS